MLHHFANTESWRPLLLGASLLPNCTGFLSATLFERGAHSRATGSDRLLERLVENGNQLIYSTSDQAVTGSFGGSIPFLTLERLGVAFPYEQRRNSVLFDDDRNRALKQSNGNDQMVLIFDPQENPLRAR